MIFNISQNAIKSIIKFSLIIFFFALNTKISFADTACGEGSYCLGTNTYLRVYTCEVFNNSYCGNGTYNANEPHTCPNPDGGGVPGSCVAQAEGKNGCLGNSLIQASEENCICVSGNQNAGLNSCSGHGTPCNWSVYSGTCMCEVTEPSCGDPQPGPLSCCVSCSTDCTGKCGRVNDCGEACPACDSCGNGICESSESYLSCSSDCSAPEPVCGDGACNGSETCSSCAQDGCCSGTVCGNTLCESTENCNNCSTDCGTCTTTPVCGDKICVYPETCSTCTTDCGNCSSNYCGDWKCTSPSETCSNCSKDCGECDSYYCGDSSCDLLQGENCASCEEDCGACPSSVAFFQVMGGNIYAGEESSKAIRSIIPGITCIESPICLAALLIPGENIEETNPYYDLSDGVAITGGGEIDTFGFTTLRQPNVQAVGTKYTKIKENYSRFTTLYSIDPTRDDSASFGSTDNANKPTDNKEYYHLSSSLTIRNPWTVNNNQTIVVFIEGSLNILDENSVEQLIQVEEGSILIFFVKGDITIDESVGTVTRTIITPSIEGIYYTDSTLTIQSDNNTNTRDKRFIGEGIFIAQNGISLQRNYIDTTRRGDVLNQTVPTETFIYRPDFIVNLPPQLKRAHYIWQQRK